MQMAGKYATAEQILSLRKELGLTRPLIFQYLDFLFQAFTFDWGSSWQTRESINSMLLKGIGPSLSLTLPAFMISFVLSLLVALFSASSRGATGTIDRTVTFLCLGLMSVSFLVYIISFQYFFAFRLGWFPINGWNGSWTGRWAFLYLPWIVSIVVTLGPNILIFRSAILDETFEDYVQTGKAKGVHRLNLFTKHILRNAMIPIVTVVVMQLPFLITGNLLLEAFFGIPGLGGLLIQAIQNADFPVVKAFTLVGSFLYVIFNLMADLLFIYFDPRVRLQ